MRNITENIVRNQWVLPSLQITNSLFQLCYLSIFFFDFHCHLSGWRKKIVIKRDTTGLWPVFPNSWEASCELQSACFEKVVFSHFFNARKAKRTAKFDGSKPRYCEDKKGIVAPEIGAKSFGTFETQAPGYQSAYFSQSEQTSPSKWSNHNPE